MRTCIRGSAKARLEHYSIPEPNSGCWLWTGTCSTKGYGQTVASDGRRGSAHRVSYEEYVGPIAAGMRVCHRCDTPSCINPQHLFLGTSKDNYQDAAAKGRNCHGESHGCARLTEQQVLAIRASSSTQVELAAHYGVRQAHISRIKLGQSWKHLA